MKTYIKGLLVIALVCLSLTGCGHQETKQEVDIVEPNDEVVKFDEAAFMQAIKPTIEFLQSCDEELFGADVDFTNAFNAAYRFVEDEYQFVSLYSAKEELPEGLVEDPAAAVYYPVHNFKTLEELQNYAANLIDLAIMPNFDLLAYDFIEYEGQLYLCRGGRGYGNLLPQLDTLKYVGADQDIQTVQLDYYMFEEFDHTALIDLTLDNDNWKIVAITNK